MYKVIDIIDPDYGCEGIPDGEEALCDVVLEDQEDGSRITMKAPDRDMFARFIDRGSIVEIRSGEIFPVKE